MRLTWVIPGCGGMYCGASVRDVVIARSLTARGCDVRILPLYTPLRLDGPWPGPSEIFLGGINVWLDQHVPGFGRAPGFFRRLLDRPALLNWASGFAVRTKPAGLGPMTVSVLKGEYGRQAAELERLLALFEVGPRPDVVVLGNSLLSTIAPPLRKRLGVPIVCGIQGEDVFLEAMPEPYRSQARNLVRANAGSIDALIAPSDWYAPQAAEFLGVPPERIHVVPTGVDADAITPATLRPRRPFTIGCLSRITPGKGLDLLVEACRILVKERAEAVRLHIAGQVLDRSFWRSIRATLRRQNLDVSCEVHDVGDLKSKVAFLRGCSAFALPSRVPEVRGTAVLEAMAAGLPVVVPESGVFPEIIERTGGGRLFTPGDPARLADELVALMNNPKAADATGLAARAGICEHYSADATAEKMLELCTGLTDERKQQ